MGDGVGGFVEGDVEGVEVEALAGLVWFWEGVEVGAAEHG